MGPHNWMGKRLENGHDYVLWIWVNFSDWMEQIRRRDGVSEAHSTDEDLPSLLPRNGVSIRARPRLGGVWKMKKIWLLRYNNGTADVWDEEKGPPSWPYIDAFDVEDALKEFHSDYATLLARHNALVDAVVHIYNSGYHAGHHYTVEGGYVDIHPSDMGTYHAEEVAELLAALVGEG